MTDKPWAAMKFLNSLQFFAFIIKTCEVASQCKTTESVYGKYLKYHVISTSDVAELMDCKFLCDDNLKCKSWNFRLNAKRCELNDADRFTHPHDYEDRHGHIYCDTAKPLKGKSYRSCAEVQKQAKPGAQSGYYWIKIKDREVQVYCDMENYGGGWTLLVSISSSNNDHLQRAEHNCFNAVLCVPFINETIPGRKMSDGEIHEIGVTEGTFRVDAVTQSVNTVFYRIPSGASSFNSSCHRGTCPRVIISYSYPYVWESNCKGTQLGFQISNGCHAVFDGHDSSECGDSSWISSEYHGRRILYGYGLCGSKGLYYNQQGLLFIK